MTVTHTVDGVDVSATVTPDWALTESADKGTVAIGGFNLDDPGSAILIPALKDYTVEISDATTVRAFTGITTVRDVIRNEIMVAGTDRGWQVQATDLNAVWMERVLHGVAANRPAETDIDRITWLLSSGFIPTVHDLGMFDTSAPVPMDATDYTGQFPNDILVAASEASGYNFFAYWSDGDGEIGLGYRLDGASGFWDSDLLISNDPADIDDVDVFAPDEPADSNIDPRLTYSGVLFMFAGGANIYVTRPATETAFRVREISITNLLVGHASTAIALATSYLERVSGEILLIKVRLKLAAADANRVRAGMRMQIKLTHVPGLTDYVWLNVNKRTIAPTDGTQTFFWLTLELTNLVNTGFHGGTTAPGTYNPSTPPTNCGETDSFARDDGDISDGPPASVSDSTLLWVNTGSDAEISGGSLLLGSGGDVDPGEAHIGPNINGGGTFQMPFPFHSNIQVSEVLNDTFDPTTALLEFSCANTTGSSTHKVSATIQWDADGTVTVTLSDAAGNSVSNTGSAAQSFPCQVKLYVDDDGSGSPILRATVNGVLVTVDGADATPSAIVDPPGFDRYSLYQLYQSPDAGATSLYNDLDIANVTVCTVAP